MCPLLLPRFQVAGEAPNSGQSFFCFGVCFFATGFVPLSKRDRRSKQTYSYADAIRLGQAGGRLSRDMDVTDRRSSTRKERETNDSMESVDAWVSVPRTHLTHLNLHLI